jgi:23S rRNA (cytosine1962-C5)-methyltransferase
LRNRALFLYKIHKQKLKKDFMQTDTKWSDYEIIGSGGGEKLERWADVYLLRPDPQAIWPAAFDFKSYPRLNAYYTRSESGGGGWTYIKKIPDQWTVGWRGLKFLIKPMGFKHTGLFPEQAVNWSKMIDAIKGAPRPRQTVSVLNLFAYTGAATVACLSAGASVCHVDSAKNMVERAGDNVRLNNFDGKNIRYIVDDCTKFVRREIARGKTYDAIIMDPPSYGRGPNAEMWKIEADLYPLVELCAKLLSDSPLFFLINSYTTGLQPAVLNNILALALKSKKGQIESYEVCLPTKEGIVLPCGASGLMRFIESADGRGACNDDSAAAF